MKCMVGVPSLGAPTWPLFDSLVQMKAPDGGEIQYCRSKPLAVDLARNYLVDRLLLSDCDAILMVDSDASLHPRTLERLASWGQPIVGALAFSQYWPIVPTVCAGRTDDYYSYHVRVDETVDWLHHHTELIRPGPALLDMPPPDSLRPLHVGGGFTGGHCLFVHRRVFEAIEPPWFSNRKGYEDRYFCEQAIAAGFPLYVDRSVVAGHVNGDQQTGALQFLACDLITDWEDGSFHIGGKQQYGRKAEAAGAPVASAEPDTAQQNGGIP